MVIMVLSGLKNYEWRTAVNINPLHHLVIVLEMSKADSQAPVPVSCL